MLISRRPQRGVLRLSECTWTMTKIKWSYLVVIFLLLAFVTPQWVGPIGWVVLCAAVWAVIGIIEGLVLGKQRAWVVKRVVALALASTGLLATYIITRPPSEPPVFRVQIRPMDYDNVPLSRALVDLARQVDAQRRFVCFVIYDETVADRNVTLQTDSNLDFRSALTSVVDSADCDFHYGICGTCGGIIGGINIVPKGEDVSYEGFEMFIDKDGIQTRGGSRSVPASETVSRSGAA